MTTRDFHLSDILSVTDGRLVSNRHMEGIYDILNFMTGDNLFTHSLPRASVPCRAALLAQHPQLAELVDPDTELEPENVADWVALQVAKFGERLPVTPLAEWQHKNPLAELAEMAPGKPVVVVTR